MSLYDRVLGESREKDVRVAGVGWVKTKAAKDIVVGDTVFLGSPNAPVKYVVAKVKRSKNHVILPAQAGGRDYDLEPDRPVPALSAGSTSRRPEGWGPQEMKDAAREVVHGAHASPTHKPVVDSLNDFMLTIIGRGQEISDLIYAAMDQIESDYAKTDFDRKVVRDAVYQALMQRLGNTPKDRQLGGLLADGLLRVGFDFF